MRMAPQRGTRRRSTRVTAGSNTYATTSASTKGRRTWCPAPTTAVTTTALIPRKIRRGPGRGGGPAWATGMAGTSGGGGTDARGWAGAALPAPGRDAAGHVGEIRQEVLPRLLERLGHDADIGEDGHEVGVPRPARD